MGWGNFFDFIRIDYPFDGFSALLRVDLEEMAQTVRTKRRPKLPTVLSVAEIQRLLARVEPEYALMVRLL